MRGRETITQGAGIPNVRPLADYGTSPVKIVPRDDRHEIHFGWVRNEAPGPALTLKVWFEDPADPANADKFITVGLRFFPFTFSEVQIDCFWVASVAGVVPARIITLERGKLNPADPARITGG